MSVEWYFYCDSNGRAEKIETFLLKRGQHLTCFQTLADLQSRLEDSSNATLFLQPNNVYNVYELSEEISIKHPHIYIIILSEESNENTKKAMHSGASNLLTLPIKTEELVDVVTQAHRYMNYRAEQQGVKENHEPKNDSRVISVCSPRGGIGRTLLTVNLAASLAREGKMVAVLDTNIQFGDVTMYFDVKPKNTIYEWVKEGYDKGRFSVSHYLTKHDSGVAILAPPPRPEFFEIITEHHIEMAITELRKDYDVIIVDTAATISEIHLKSLVLSDDILLLMTSDIPAVRNTKLYMETLESLKLIEKIDLILNRDSRKTTIDQKRLEEILQKPIFSMLPDQPGPVAVSINEGYPLVLKDAKNALSKAVLSLSTKLMPDDPERVQSGLKSLKSMRWPLMSR
ncbi:AAA family ATPase [Alkalihalobacillus sp. R86527]|uniref:AAA family ATPase n=1 Tax=Alkalihalobacillus sp. R86527 TaxID=3093863 RepID=UPI00366E2126